MWSGYETLELQSRASPGFFLVQLPWSLGVGPEQEGLEPEPAAGWGGPYRLARASGSFQPAAYALGLGASRSLHAPLSRVSVSCGSLEGPMGF